MKHKKGITSVAFILLGLGGLHAQQNTIFSGGEATGTGGTASYSLGQIVYNTNTGTNGNVTQGLQQPYEIYIATGINETAINIEMSAFPNPTTNYLTLKVESPDQLSYQLFDMQGKVIENKKLNTNSSTIKMEGLPKTAYFLKVTNNNQVIKTFKIIKN